MESFSFGFYIHFDAVARTHFHTISPRCSLCRSTDQLVGKFVASEPAYRVSDMTLPPIGALVHAFTIIKDLRRYGPTIQVSAFNNA